MKQFSVFSSEPVDNWGDQGCINLKDFSEYLIEKIKKHPKITIGFSEMWSRVVSMIVWVFSEQSKVIDCRLRSNDIYIKLTIDEYLGYDFDLVKIFLFFKADNNGTTYMVYPKKVFCKCELPKHEQDCQWELVNGTNEEIELFKTSHCYSCKN